MAQEKTKCLRFDSTRFLPPTANRTSRPASVLYAPSGDSIPPTTPRNFAPSLKGGRGTTPKTTKTTENLDPQSRKRGTEDKDNILCSSFVRLFFKEEILESGLTFEILRVYYGYGYHAKNVFLLV